MDDYVSEPVTSCVERREPLNVETQHGLGAFYTCPSTAIKMAEWVIRRAGMRVLEPSFGSGIFLRAAKKVASRRFGNDIYIVGAELSKEEFEHGKRSLDPTKDLPFYGDFLRMPRAKVDAVLGNPPYVRLRHLPQRQASAAHAAAIDGLGHPMESSGSLWMPFVLRCLEFLNVGGRLALVLPFELTYVRYAQPLWKKLAESFSELSIVRVRERIFPDILQDVVILYADGFGGRTSDVELKLFETLTDYLSDRSSQTSRLSTASLERGERDFLRAHLDPALRELLQNLRETTSPLSEQCNFNIGYVSGDKDFFHPDSQEQRRWKLPARSLTPSLVSGRSMRGAGILTSGLADEKLGSLFLPVSTKLSKAEKAYIQYGESIGVSSRYKCRVRDPWYVVPGVRVPDLMLSVFAERPVLMKNDRELVASNSLLAGFLRPGYSANGLISAWYSSLTLLACEMQVHSLGGGVLVLIPGEVAKIRLPKVMNSSAAHLRKLNSTLRKGDLRSAYALGDEFVLKNVLRLSGSEIELIRSGVSRLEFWRTGARN